MSNIPTKKDIENWMAEHEMTCTFADLTQAEKTGIRMAILIERSKR